MRRRLFIIVTVSGIASMLSCREPIRSASSASPSDFDGKWHAVWNWDSTQTATLEISGGKVKATNFPVIADTAVKAITAEGKSDYQQEYGSNGHPCVLISLPGAWRDVAIFISKDKSHLLYTADINRYWKLEFSR
jgi:hypothetical protein